MMTHKATVQVDMGQGLTVVHSFESIVGNSEEAEEFGEHCARLMAAFNKGYGKADISEWR